MPLFFSRRLEKLNRLPRARGPYAIDSGEFTELSKYGERSITVDRYIAEVRRCSDCIGVPVFAAQMDHMCEPFILEKTPRVVGVATSVRNTACSFARALALSSHIDWRIQGAASLRRFAGTKLTMQGGSPTDSGGLSEGREGQSWAEKRLKNGRILVEFQKLGKAARRERDVFSAIFALHAP